MYSFIRSPCVATRRYSFIKNCIHSKRNIQYLSTRHRSVTPVTSLLKCSSVPDYSIRSSNASHCLSCTSFVVSPLRNSNSGTFLARNISLSSVIHDKEPLKPSSKVEASVQEIKKQKEELPAEAPQKAVVKKSIKQKIVDELLHYYHGFRLLFIDMKIATGLIWRILNGKTLTRREHRMLVRTVGDMFRLLPFSVFIIVPFMEFLLPVFIKLFPGMLPSTFQTTTEQNDKLKQNLKVKLEMAKFLQKTLDEMSVQHKDHNSQQAKEFVEWFNKVRTSGEQVSTDEIMKYSKLFEDEITLDSLSRSQLVALCRVLEVQTLGTNYLLRFQLRMKLRSLAADDKMIEKEGVDSLTLTEVQQACRVRGMRAYGVSEARLRSSLTQWLDLSLNKKVPPSLLLLSRALMLPETVPTSDRLKATISVLPDAVVTQTKAAIGEKEGKIDNKVKIEVMKEEERKIKEERQERKEEKQRIEQQEKEILVDKAPIISAEATPVLKDTAKVISTATEAIIAAKPKEELVTKDLEVLEHALDNISKDKKLIIEKEEIEDLKEEMADYQEDVQDLKNVTANEATPKIKESKAAQRLFKKVNSMISKMDGVLEQLETKEKQLKQQLEADSTPSEKKKEELLKIDDIMVAIRQIKDVPNESRLEQIKNVLGKIDDDADGSIKVEDVLKVIEFLGKENVRLSPKQVDELVELLDKEEILEVENKIEKALLKEKEMQCDKSCKEQNVSDPSVAKDIDKPRSLEKSSSSDSTKPKVETKSNVIAPSVSGIDSTDKKGQSKTL